MILSWKEFLNENKKNIDTKVSKNGKPLVMYHGGSFNGGEFKGDAWFTTSKKDANYYAKQFDGSVTKAHLIIRNPLYTGYIKHLSMKPTEEILKSVNKRKISIKIEDGIISYIETNSGVLIAKDIGCDGVIDLHDGEILDAVVFHDKQIIIL